MVMNIINTRSFYQDHSDVCAFYLQVV